MIAIKKENGRRMVFDGDLIIGEVFRMHKNLGFGISLIGFQWRNEKLTKSGGPTAIRIRRLKDCECFISEKINEFRSNNS